MSETLAVFGASAIIGGGIAIFPYASDTSFFFILNFIAVSTAILFIMSFFGVKIYRKVFTKKSRETSVQ